MMAWIDEGSDRRLAVIIYSMIIFNGIPFLLFMLYTIVSSIVIYSSAVLIHVLSFLFGLAIFTPVVLFCSLTALVVSFVIIAIERIFTKNLWHPPALHYQQQLKVD